MLPVSVFATAQQSDVLYFERKNYRLNANPLEVLFIEKPDLRPNSNFRTSANHRGYVATFSIVDGSLFIQDIVFNKPEESIVNDLFPSESERFLNWYSGVLTIPLGEQVDYFHMAYATLYENYIMIRIVNGRVIEVSKMNLDEFQIYKNRQHDAYQETEDYREYLEYLESIKSSGSDFNVKWYIHRVGRYMEKVNLPFEQWWHI